MRIAILSDFHLGFGRGTEREGEAEELAKRAMEIAKDSDLIVVAGDIFDRASPDPDTLKEAYEVFSIPQDGEGARWVGGKPVDRRALQGVPVVAIHGTHEFTRKHINPVKLLEKARFLVYLHGENVVFEKGDRVNIFGIGGVPERYAGRFFREYAKPPVPGPYNMFVFHQSLKGFLYDPSATLSLEDLPPGYDLYIDGHIHSGSLGEYSGKRLLLTGSTVITQLKKNEIDGDKYVWFLDSETGEVEGKKIPQVRDFFYREIAVYNERGPEIEEKIREVIEACLREKKLPEKPVIRVRVTGSAVALSSVRFHDLERMYGEEAIVRIEREMVEVKEGAEEIRRRHEEIREQLVSRERFLERVVEKLSSRMPVPPDIHELLELLSMEDGRDRAAEYIEGVISRGHGK